MDSSGLTLVVYPNPTGNYLNLRLPGFDCTGTEISIYDMAGCLTMQSTVDMDITRLDVSSLTPGIYYIRIFYEQKVFTGSFVMSEK